MVAGRRQLARKPTPHQVCEALRRRDETTAPRRIRRGLERGLISDPGERVGRIEARVDQLGGADLGDQARVGEAAVTRAGAHAVDDLHAGVGRGRDDEAPGAHAEREHRAAGGLLDEAIGGGAEGRVPGEAAVLQAVDQGLRVLDADAEREGLEGQADPGGLQPALDVAGGVSGSDDDGRRRDEFAAVQADAADLAGGTGDQPVDAGLEADLRAGRGEVLAHRRDHPRQPVGADVRPRVDQNVGRRPVAAQRLEHQPHRPALARPRVQLAVGEGARAALAEAVVAVGHQLAALAQARQVASARPDLAAALEHQRPDPRARQAPRAEHPRRSGPDDHHGWLSRHARKDRRKSLARERELVAEAQRELDVDADLAAAGVDRSVDDLDGAQGRLGQASGGRGRAAQGRRVEQRVGVEVDAHVQGVSRGQLMAFTRLTTVLGSLPGRLWLRMPPSGPAGFQGTGRPSPRPHPST